ARTAEAILVQLTEYEKKILDRAEALFKQQPSAEVLVESIKVQTTARQQAMLEVRQQGDAASAKLAYLLGLDCDVHLVPVDPRLDAVELIDARACSDELIQRAVTAGPGVRQLENL